MIDVQLEAESAIVTVRPSEALTEEDFQLVASVVDPFVEHRGNLTGLIIHAEAGFPGWADFAGLIAHLGFVRNHHRKIKRVALVTDDSVAAHLPGLASHFVAAEIKAFSGDSLEEARQWLLG